MIDVGAVVIVALDPFSILADASLPRYRGDERWQKTPRFNYGSKIDFLQPTQADEEANNSEILGRFEFRMSLHFPHESKIRIVSVYVLLGQWKVGLSSSFLFISTFF